MAFFSSKGPATGHGYLLKPEVVAPGVDITSTLPGNSSGPADGTSMSAPHVASVAALLKQLHPDWQPDEVKSAIVTTAWDLGYEAVEQGAGLVQAVAAAEASVFFSKPVMSFGLTDLVPDVWTAVDTITVSNKGEATSLTGSSSGIIPGVSLTIEPASFSLSSGESLDVIIRLEVDNDIVPFSDHPSHSYSGIVTFAGDNSSFRVPWIFVKSPVLRVTYDQPFPTVILSNTTDFFVQPAVLDPNRLEFLVPFGSYDLLLIDAISGPLIVTILPGARLIMKENVSVSGQNEITINSAQAEHVFDLNGVDENGTLLTERENSPDGLSRWYQSRYRIAYPASSFLSDVYIQFFTSDSLFLSEFSNRFTLFPGEFYSAMGSRNETCVIQHPPRNGVTQSSVFANDPGDLRNQNLAVLIPPTVTDPRVWMGNGRLLSFGEGFSHSATALTFEDTQSERWTGKVFLTPNVDPGYSFTASVVLQDLDIPIPIPTPIVSTHPFRINGDGIESVADLTSSPVTYHSAFGDTLLFGSAPVRAFADVSIGTSRIFGAIDFSGPLNERRVADLANAAWKVRDASGAVIAGQPFNFSPFVDVAVTPGVHTIEISNPAATGLFRSHLSLFAETDTRRSDPVPANLTSLKILNSQGRISSHLQMGEAGTLVFSAADNISRTRYKSIVADSTRIFYRENGTTPWNELAYSTIAEESAAEGHDPVGYIYEADLSELTTGSPMAADLKIVVHDQENNITTHILEPAVIVGNFVVSVDEDETDDAFSLSQNYPNPFNPVTSIKYALPSDAFVTLDIFNVLGEKVETIVSEFQPAGDSRVEFNGEDRASGIYFYKLTAGESSLVRRMILLK